MIDAESSHAAALRKLAQAVLDDTVSRLVLADTLTYLADAAERADSVLISISIYLTMQQKPN